MAAATYKKINGAHRKAAIKKEEDEIHPSNDPRIVFAFKCGNKSYFQFDDFNNVPPLRGLKTLVFYEEMRMKCSLEYLEFHTEAVDKILTSEKINIFELKKLNDQLKQRLFIALDIELLFKVASIIFFDKSENYLDYDFVYNSKKIEYWKAHDGVDFFLQPPLKNLFPILNDMDENLQMYSEVVKKMNEVHMDNLLQFLPADVISKLKNKSSFSVAETPPRLKTLRS